MYVFIKRGLSGFISCNEKEERKTASEDTLETLNGTMQNDRFIQLFCKRKLQTILTIVQSAGRRQMFPAHLPGGRQKIRLDL